MPERQSPDSATQLQGFDTFVHAIMQSWSVRGVAIAIVRDDEKIYAQGFGQRDAAQQLPVTTQTLFPIASCTKAFTTATMGILVDQGKLDWDTPVRAYIPDFKLHDPLATERVTPRDLVSHRTGLPRHDLVWYNNTTSTRRELLTRLQYLEPTQDFRSFWQYQNLMFMVAGYLIEVISGQTWEAFVQHHLFHPLEMSQSNFDIVHTASKADDYSHPYRKIQGEVKEVPFYGAQAAAAPVGGMVSNITEMSHWVQMHLNRGKYKGRQIISTQQLQQIHTPQMVVPQTYHYPEKPYASYALGWKVEPYRDYPMIHHSGSIDGFRALTTLFPNQHIGMVVLSNLNQLNIPEILTYNAFERLMQLDETPWNERFLQEHQTNREAEDKGQQRSETRRIAGTKPSHPLIDYTGDFEHPGYGILSVVLNEGQLQGSFNDIPIPISHYHYDIFDFALERMGEAIKGSFQSNVHGNIDTLILPFEPTGNDIVFKRVPDTTMQARAFLERFIGIYELMQMQLITVSFKAERTLTLTLPGQPVYELEPYKGTLFLTKGRSSIYIEFHCDASGSVMGIEVTLPDGVFYAAKQV